MTAMRMKPAAERTGMNARGVPGNLRLKMHGKRRGMQETELPHHTFIYNIHLLSHIMAEKKKTVHVQGYVVPARRVPDYDRTKPTKKRN
jgi:hypothetical protein